MTDTMRDRFTRVVGDILDSDEKAVVVLAVISRGLSVEAGVEARHPDRIIDVGIREQAQVGIGAGLALEGFKPILSGYAPFLVERAFEQVKLDFAHQGTSALLASVGGSWDSSGSGRTHQAPEDVALISSLREWTVHVPGHPDELEALLRRAYNGGDRTYIRMTSDANAKPLTVGNGRSQVLRSGSTDAFSVLAVGPIAGDVLDATAGLDVTVLYTNTPYPIDAGFLRHAVTGNRLAIVEPYLVGSSTAAAAEALADRPMRFHAHGVRDVDLRKYGLPGEHKRAHGLDAEGIREFVDRLAA